MFPCGEVIPKYCVGRLYCCAHIYGCMVSLGCLYMCGYCLVRLDVGCRGNPWLCMMAIC